VELIRVKAIRTAMKCPDHGSRMAILFGRIRDRISTRLREGTRPHSHSR
jgi:hypothetical protein